MSIICSSEKQEHSQGSQTSTEKQPTKKRYYGYYPENVKRSAVEAVQSGHSIREVSLELGICYKNIGRWLAQGTKRRPSHRPKRNHALEQCLQEWILETTKVNGKKLTIVEVRNQALKMNTDASFKASVSWVRQYIKRCNLLPLMANTHN